MRVELESEARERSPIKHKKKLEGRGEGGGCTTLLMVKKYQILPFLDYVRF